MSVTAVYVAVALSSASALLALLICLYQRNPLSVFYFAVAALIGTAVVDLDYSIQNFPAEALFAAHAYALIFNAIMIALLMTKWGQQQWPSVELVSISVVERIGANRLFLISLVCFGLAFSLRSVAPGQLAFGQWAEVRDISAAASLVNYLFSLSTAVSIVATLVSCILLYSRRYLHFSALVVLATVAYLIVGARSMLGLYAVAVLLWISQSDRRVATRLMLGLGLLFVGLYLHSGLRVLRFFTLVELVDLFDQGSLAATLRVYSEVYSGTGGEETQFRTFYFLFVGDLSDGIYYRMLAWARIILFFVPSEFLEIKPPNIATYYAFDALRSGWASVINYHPELSPVVFDDIDPFQISATYHPTVFGDAMANAWWTGVLVYPVILAILSALVRYVTFRTSPLLLVPIMLVASNSLVLLARGSTVNSITSAILTLGVAAVLLWAFVPSLARRA